MRNSRRGAALAWLFVVVSCGFAAIACGKGGGKVPHPGTGKAPPIFDGGAQGTLDGSGPGLGFDGSANGCNYVGSQLDPTQYDQCPMCTHARCLLTGLVPKDMQTQLADCPDGVSKCVPDPYVQYMGVVLLPSCKSLSGLEGRCVSVCVPSVAAQADRLPRDVCKDDERCAPCYDPITGEDTGSCHVGCDPGPVDPPKKFARCCHDLGACVPSDDVPVEQRSLLGKESCAQKDELCAPDTFTAPAGFVPASCKSIDGAEGRCIPDCIPSVESQAKQLPRSSCGEHELCAPCYDPVTAKSTGACNLSNDPGPKNPPQTFPECCGGDARCVPKSLVPKDQQALLGHDSCKDATDLCVPNDLAADPSSSPSICASWDGAEGRCLLACLPDVAKNAANLTRGACKKGFLCSPCFDPLTGEDTGACRVGGDPGPKGPPYTFPECCGGASRCVPKPLVPSDQQSLLGQDSCSEDTSLCVPKTLIADQSFVPATCSASIGNAEGRCLLACLPDVAKNASVLTQDGCASGELCTPCFDPASGADTGACHVGGDTGPTQSPYTFPECCGGLSACVPKTLVPDDQEPLLGQDSCSDSASLCVPKTLASDPQSVAPSCMSWNGAEGRCLPACLPSVAANAANLTKGSCSAGELCSPCYDPVTGVDTGACHIGGDPGPENAPYEFPDCCGTASQCIPKALVPDAQEPLLSQGGCSDVNSLCVPKALAANPALVPTTCSSWNGAEGRCLSTCLPSVSANAANLTKDICASGELCSPCYDPVTGIDTGACHVGGDTGPKSAPYTFPTCCSGASQCIPKALVPDAQEAMLVQGGCSDANSLCVPKALAANPALVPTTCSSWDGAEGRCLSTCLPSVSAKASQLTKDICQTGELCSPCYDPVTGADTGACHVGGDTGPKNAPYTFPGCCGSLSQCIPTALVPMAQQSQVDQSTCASNHLCVPKTLVANPSWVPPSCASWGNAEGRCLPACLPSVAAKASQLTQSTCAANNLCAPCYDPLTGADTGACHVGGDPGPTQAKYTFPLCCSDGASGQLGTCVPSQLVPMSQQALLGKDTCTGSSDLCAPTDLANDAYVPTACKSWLNAEGRCLPQCLPSVAAQASSLKKDSCAQGKLCVPCFDPITGASTGACTIDGDAPANATPVKFPVCCPTPSPSGTKRGTCVPTQAAGSNAASLPVMNCETQTNDADAYVCAPNEKVKTPTTLFGMCTTTFNGPACSNPFDFLCLTARSTASGYIAGKSGACVPSCMLSEQSTTITLYGTFTTDQLYGQSSCAAGEECGPCNYPMGHPKAGQSTGLCY